MGRPEQRSPLFPAEMFRTQGRDGFPQQHARGPIAPRHHQQAQQG